jgi:thiol:disulfide interchange protein DsbD
MTSFRRLFLWAAGAALLVAFLPSLLPAGPESNLNAAGHLASGQLWMGAAVIFAGGLLTALTPCVYPLIPITVSVFGARSAEGRGKAVLLTSSYVVGMGLVFSTLGVVAARTGAAFGSVLGNPLIVVGLAVFLLALATSMFGAFELALPSSWATRLNTVGGNGLLGAFLMGSVAGFLAAPCTGPVLTGLLAFVAKTQSTVLGGTLLFIYALGIGVPFMLIGIFAVKLPRGGVWMDWVKSVLGIALVALAAMYLRDVFPQIREPLKQAASALGSMKGAAVASALAGVGVLIGAVHRSFKDGARHFVLKGAGVALVVLALLLRVGAGAAAASEMRWDHKFPVRAEAGFLADFDAVLAEAKAQGKPVMVDFFADWCAACVELDHQTYPVAAVREGLSRFVTVKVDATNLEDDIDTLYERYGIKGLPTVLFFAPDGRVLSDPLLTGFVGPERFVDELKKVP